MALASAFARAACSARAFTSRRFTAFSAASAAAAAASSAVGSAAAAVVSALPSASDATTSTATTSGSGGAAHSPYFEPNHCALVTPSYRQHTKAKSSSLRQGQG